MCFPNVIGSLYFAMSDPDDGFGQLLYILLHNFCFEENKYTRNVTSHPHCFPKCKYDKDSVNIYKINPLSYVPIYTRLINKKT